MSTTNFPRSPEADGIELITNDEQETVTLVADLDESDSVPPSEWITVGVEDTVNLDEHR